jgi:hypothetical protein
MRRFLPLFLLAAAPALSQPAITGLLNNYSYILPSLPNYGIAEGSIFIITGTGLATVEIDGSAPASNGSVTQSFGCAVPATAGQFTIPPSLLLAMPASSSGQLVLHTYALPVTFTAPGMDAGFVVGDVNTTITTAYK